MHWVEKCLRILFSVKFQPKTLQIRLTGVDLVAQQVQRKDLSVFKKAGLEGLEVYCSYHDSEMAEFYRGMADEFDLVPTAGSDFHGRIKPNVKLGSIGNGGYWMVEKLKKRRPE